MTEEERCPVCQSFARTGFDIYRYMITVDCPVCGLYQMDGTLLRNNRLAPFLFYNRSLPSDTERLRFTTFPQDFCDEANEEFKRNKYPERLVHIDAAKLQDWYPKTFLERIDLILKRLSELAEFIGSWILFDDTELQSLLFVERYGYSKEQGLIPRDKTDCFSQMEYMIKALRDGKFIEIESCATNGKKKIRLSPIGYAKLDALLPNVAVTQEQQGLPPKQSFTKSAPAIVKESFSNEYLSRQKNILISALSSDPAEAIGKAKELLESSCKTILEKLSIDYGKDDRVQQLAKKVLKALKLLPDDVPPDAYGADAVKQMLGNLSSITGNLAELRNAFGVGHGRPDSFRGLKEEHAKLAVQSSLAFSEFVWAAFEKEQNRGSDPQSGSGKARESDSGDDWVRLTQGREKS